MGLFSKQALGLEEYQDTTALQNTKDTKVCKMALCKEQTVIKRDSLPENDNSVFSASLYKCLCSAERKIFKRMLNQTDLIPTDSPLNNIYFPHYGSKWG